MNISETMICTVPEEFAGERLDLFLTQALDDMSRSFIQKLIARGLVTLEGRVMKASYRCKTDEALKVLIPEPEMTDLEPWDHPISIIYRDDDIVVIEKEPGIVVHPGAGNREKTLVNALLSHFPDLPVIGGEYRPGIVHRLDRDTAGVMVIARNDRAHRKLVEAFAERRVDKKYYALVSGRRPDDGGMIDLPIGRHPVYGQKMTIRDDGRDAKTGYTVMKTWNIAGETFSLLDVTLYTGRTHQIRVHLSSTGTPIVGDPIYSKKWKKYKTPWLLLQSWYLGFDHPVTGKPVSFTLEKAAHFAAFIRRLDNQSDYIG